MHRRQDALPFLSWYIPGSQLSQLSLLASLATEPGSHSMHALAPGVFEAFPGMQGMHDAWALAF
jgi:hypothetical protein